MSVISNFFNSFLLYHRENDEKCLKINKDNLQSKTQIENEHKSQIKIVENKLLEAKIKLDTKEKEIISIKKDNDKKIEQIIKDREEKIRILQNKSREQDDNFTKLSEEKNKSFYFSILSHCVLFVICIFKDQIFNQLNELIAYNS